MRIVIALGGNALLRRGEPLTAENQRHNVRGAAEALMPLVVEHQLVISHGNGPQVGLLALQGASGSPEDTYPLDILGAETEGMIGYLIEQELGNLLPSGHPCATLLTQTEVDAHDPAFSRPTKPIGPVYPRATARKLAGRRGWNIAPDGDGFRRVVASPRPRRILEMNAIRILVEQGVTVICVGGGGIPVVQRADGSMIGVEAVIDKDHASVLLAVGLGADALLMLTDVDAVYRDWGKPGAHAIRCVSPKAVRRLNFEPGSMGPKVEAACSFVENTGGVAAIGRLADAGDVLAGNKGTLVRQDSPETGRVD